MTEARVWRVREMFPAVLFANEHYSATIHTNARERLEVPGICPFLKPDPRNRNPDRAPSTIAPTTDPQL